MAQTWNRIFFLAVTLILLNCSNKEVKKEYYSNGQLESKIHLENGKLDGIAKFYYKNGQIKFTKKFEDGKLNGELKEYYKNGQVKKVGAYRQGQGTGMLKWYYKNGQLKTVNEYRNGKMDGIIKEYYKSGQLKAFEIRKDDSITRFLRKFEKDGNFIGEERDIKVEPKYDTLYLDQSHDFVVGSYGPMKNYKRVRVGIYIRNVDTVFQSDSVASFDTRFFGEGNNLSRKNERTFFGFVVKKKDGTNWIGYIPKEDDKHDMEYKTSKNKDVQFGYEPKETGSHRLLGFYQLIPHDTSDFQYHVAEGFSVQFYVKKRPNM